MSAGPVPAEDAVRAYVDALLCESRAALDAAPALAPTPTPTPIPAAPAHPAYHVCRIGRIRLALPAAGLERAVPMCHLAAGPRGCLGTLDQPDGPRYVVDLAGEIAPDVARETPDTLLILSRGHWALACQLEPELAEWPDQEIRWREAGGARPWLAGMTLDGTCAVAGIDALGEWLDQRIGPIPEERT